MLKRLLNRFRAQEQLVNICKRLYERGLVSGTEGNVSYKAGDIVYTTPSGISKGYVRRANIVEVSLSGEIIRAGRRKGFKRELKATSELNMHLAVYRSREDVQAIVHGHPKSCLALNLSNSGLNESIIPELTVMLGKVPNIAYKAPSTMELANAIGEAIKGTDALLMDKHGSITVGKSVEEAYNKLEQMEHAAWIILHAKLLGNVRELTPEEIKELMEIRDKTYKLTNPIVPF